MSEAGAMEAMTYVHANRENLKEKLNRGEEDFVKVENPLSDEYGALRDLITPSLLQVLNQNQHHSYPQKFFETGNVAVLDNSGTGASNKKKAAFVKSGDETDFTDAREMLQVLERDLGIELTVEESSKPFFQENRSGKIELDSKTVGFIGQFSENILNNWDIDKPTSGFELDLEKVQSTLNK
jgi:phenylalanyl-tRNA synthetase beta chain